MAQAAKILALESMKSLLTSGDYSDLTITCQSDSYKVHKAIVCSRSKFFENAIKFPGKESESNKVDLPEDDPAIVKLLLEYLYKCDYSPECLPNTPSNPKSSKTKEGYGFGPFKQWESDPHTCVQHGHYCSRPALCGHHYCGTNCNYTCIQFNCPECNSPPSVPEVDERANQLSTHAGMYAIGEQYGVVGLKKLSQEKFRCACLHFWNQSEFAVAAHSVFSTTVEEDKGLRDLVSKTISDHMELVNKPEIEALMTEYNSLTFGILKQKVSKGWR